MILRIELIAVTKSVVLLTIFLLMTLSCDQSPVDEGNKLGEIKFSYTGSDGAMHEFEKGLLLLHNFEYSDARAAFLRAQQLDSTMVMAYWGEAMTYNHPLWQNQEFEKGKAALQKLAETPEARANMAETEIERDFLHAVHLLYSPGDKTDRDEAYADFLKEMYKKYPDQHEVATFYALSILGAVPDGRDADAYEKSAAVVRKVIQENPNHPGALHYMIHANDDPSHAHLALDAAFAYSEVAADAIHALHMPSHIFLAVGMWEEVVQSNIESWKASVKRRKELDLDHDALSYHALHWLLYGHLQLGEMDKALSIISDMQEYCDSLPSRHARGYLIAMQGAYQVESEIWSHDIINPSVDTEALGLRAKSQQSFSRGLIHYERRDTDSLQHVIDQMEEQIKSSELLVNDLGVPMCSSGSNSSYSVTRSDVENAKVMHLQLKALASDLSENNAQTEELLQQAADMEYGLNFGYGPPNIFKPSHELLADFLLKWNRSNEAAFHYKKTLERAPNRRLSNIGLVRCSEIEDDIEI